MRGLQGKVIVVAGGGTTPGRPAIGGAVAVRLAEEGARVVVGDVDADAAATTVARIRAGGGEAQATLFDASDETSIRELIDGAVGRYGALHGLHANAMDMSAGTLGVDGETDICTIPLEVWRRTLDVGLTGLLLLGRYAIPHLVEAGGGGIVATASGAVYAGEPIRVAYATTKTAMTAVVRHIASAYGRKGVRANAVAPGSVLGETAIEALADDARLRVLRMARSVRLGQPEDIANAVKFLVSEESGYITGHVLAVNGGMYM